MNAGPFQDKNKLGCQLSTVQKDVMTKVNKDGGGQGGGLSLYE